MIQKVIGFNLAPQNQDWIRSDDVGAGCGAIDFEHVAGRTVVRNIFAKSPLRFLTPRNGGDAAWVYASSFGGGLVDGDSIDIRMRVRPRAKGLFLTQAATKVYKSTRKTSQSFQAYIEEEGFLAVIPDPVVCFANSNFSQEQTFFLGPRASLIWIDTICSGRYATNERWLFDRYFNAIRVMREDQMIFFDSLLLSPTAGNIADRMGRFNGYSTVLLIGPEFAQHGFDILDSLAQQAPARQAKLILAGSCLRDGEGVVLRLAATSLEEVTHLLYNLLSFLPQKLGDNPWQRKW